MREDRLKVCWECGKTHCVHLTAMKEENARKKEEARRAQLSVGRVQIRKQPVL